MDSPRMESQHDKKSNTITTEDKEKLLKIFDKIRRDIELIIGHVPELDPLWVTREDIETRREIVLEEWKRRVRIMLTLLIELKKQCESSQIHDISSRLRDLVLKKFAKNPSVQSTTSPAQKPSETMRNVEVEYDLSIEESGSVVEKVGTEKGDMFLRRSARLSRCAPPEPETAEDNDNTEDINLKSVSKEPKENRKLLSLKKSSKKPQITGKVNEVSNEQSSESEDSSEDYDDTTTTFSKTEIESEIDLGPYETPESSKNILIKKEVPVNFRLPDETEIIDVDANDGDNQVISLKELTEEEQQKVRDQIEPQLTSKYLISPITVLRNKGKYRVVCRNSKNKETDAPAIIKEEPHYLDIFDASEIIEVDSDNEEKTKAFSDLSEERQEQIRNSVEPQLVDQIPKKSLKIKICTKSDTIKIINEATGVIVNKILKTKPKASALTSKEAVEIDQSNLLSESTLTSQKTQLLENISCEVPKFNFDVNKNPFEIPKNNLNFPQSNEKVTSQEIPQTIPILSPTTRHDAGVFRFGSDNQVNPFKESVPTTLHESSPFAVAEINQVNSVVSGNVFEVSGVNSFSPMQIDPQTTEQSEQRVFHFGSDNQMNPQTSAQLNFSGNYQQFILPEGTSIDFSNLNLGEFGIGYIKETIIESEPEGAPSPVKDEMLFVLDDSPKKEEFDNIQLTLSEECVQPDIVDLDSSSDEFSESSKSDNENLLTNLLKVCSKLKIKKIIKKKKKKKASMSENRKAALRTFLQVRSYSNIQKLEKIDDNFEDTIEEGLNAIPQPSTSGNITTEDSLKQAEANDIMSITDSQETIILDDIEDAMNKFNETFKKELSDPSTSLNQKIEDIPKDKGNDVISINDSQETIILDDINDATNSFEDEPQPSTSGNKATEDQVIVEKVSEKDLVESPQVLRPWIEDDHLRFDLKKLEVTNEYLLMNFKCQGTTCSFATNNIMDLLTHFEEHENNFDDLTYFYACSYCRNIASDSNDYVQHFVDLHMNSKIQCPHCLFRAVSDNEYCFHWANHHIIKDREHLMVTEDICAAKSTDNNNLQVKCCGCSESYFLLESLEIHVEEDHASETDCTCKYCGAFVKGELYINHLKLQHNIGLFHCLDCQYGSNLLKDVTEHILLEHADDAKGFVVRNLSS